MRPIPFITTMVQAVRDERKSVIRMICEDGNDYTIPDVRFLDSGKRTYAVHNYADKEHTEKLSTVERPCPICHGDILYVQEEWRVKEAGYPPPYSVIEYKAGGTEKFDNIVAIPSAEGEWKPSIDMPKEAARLFIRVLDVQIEKLQNIDGLGAFDEGAVAAMPAACLPPKKPADFDRWSADKQNDYLRAMATSTYIAKMEFADRLVKSFADVWDSIIPKDKLPIHGWKANPWVWVIGFEKISKEEVLENA